MQIGEITSTTAMPPPLTSTSGRIPGTRRFAFPYAVSCVAGRSPSRIYRSVDSFVVPKPDGGIGERGSRTPVRLSHCAEPLSKFESGCGSQVLEHTLQRGFVRCSQPAASGRSHRFRYRVMFIEFDAADLACGSGPAAPDGLAHRLVRPSRDPWSIGRVPRGLSLPLE